MIKIKDSFKEDLNKTLKKTLDIMKKISEKDFDEFCYSLDTDNISNAYAIYASYADEMNKDTLSLVSRLEDCGIHILDYFQNVPEYFLPFCPEIIELDIPENIESIGKYSFGHLAIKTLDLSKCVKLTRIEDKAFDQCGWLEKVFLPPNLTYIADNAFSYCDKLEEIHLPDLKNIDTDKNAVLFFSCTNIKYVYCPNTVEEAKLYTFYFKRVFPYRVVIKCLDGSFNLVD